MSLVTTCPACQTTFRVTPEQLSVHRGDVRCGQCQHIFNALQKLEELTVAESAQQLHSGAFPPPAEGLQPEILMQPEVASQVEDAADASDEMTGNGFEDTVIVTLPAPLSMAPDDMNLSASLPEESPQERSPADVIGYEVEPPELAPEAGAAVDFELEFPADDQDAVNTGTVGETERDDQDLSPSPATLSAEVLPVANEEPAPLQTASPGPPPFVPSFLRQVPKRAMSLWLAVPLALLLLATAAGQIAYFMRTEISAQYPPARLWLEQACSSLACSIDLPRQVDLLTIEDSDLLDDAEHTGALVLVSALYNRASYAQAYPLLELTLTDTFDKPVLRRTFNPQEYLSADTDLKAGIPAGGEVHSRLALSVAGEKPAGYRLFVRY